MRLENLRTFLSTAVERERIRMRRAEGTPRGASSQDPIFLSRSFCNVHRRHDKTSVQVETILRGLPPEMVPAMAVCLRLNNRYGSLWMFDTQKFLSSPEYHLSEINNLGINTNAYRLNTPLGLNSRAGVHLLQTRALAAAGDLFAEMSARRQGPTVTVRDYWEAQNSLVPGMSSFIGYQAVLDLLDMGLLRGRPDDWAWAGPGAVRGLLRLRGEWEEAHWSGDSSRHRNVQSAVDPVEVQSLMLELTATADEFWVRYWAEEGREAEWNLHDTEGWLCEYDKYERARMKR